MRATSDVNLTTAGPVLQIMAKLKDLPPELHGLIAKRLIFEDCGTKSIKTTRLAARLAHVSKYWKKITVQAVEREEKIATKMYEEARTVYRSAYDDARCTKKSESSARSTMQDYLGWRDYLGELVVLVGAIRAENMRKHGHYLYLPRYVD